MPRVLSVPFQQDLDPDNAATVSAKTLGRYRQSLGGPGAFLRKHRLNIEYISELDAAAVIYKQHSTLTRSQIDYLIASLESFFPGLKSN